MGWATGAAFVCLIACVIVRAAMLRRRGVRVLVFGQTNKSDFILVPCVLALVYCVVAPGFGWPMWGPLVAPFWPSAIPGWFGVALCWLAVIGLAYSLKSFGESFRVGIDEHEPGGLITTGAFAVSRNPVYVCFIAFVAGIFLVEHNAITLIALVVVPTVIHRQIVREESFLSAHYGPAFAAYCQTVRRYV